MKYFKQLWTALKNSFTEKKLIGVTLLESLHMVVLFVLSFLLGLFGKPLQFKATNLVTKMGQAASSESFGLITELENSLKGFYFLVAFLIVFMTLVQFFNWSLFRDLICMVRVARMVCMLRIQMGRLKLVMQKHVHHL
jgi:magnesium-transporting ATPase (P-type)